MLLWVKAPGPHALGAYFMLTRGGQLRQLIFRGIHLRVYGLVMVEVKLTAQPAVAAAVATVLRVCWGPLWAL